MLNVDMMRTWRRFALVDHLDSCLVVLVKSGRIILMEAKLVQNRTKVFGNFGSADGSNKFRFGGRGGNRGLEL
jgi:hypothetical protein